MNETALLDIHQETLIEEAERELDILENFLAEVEAQEANARSVDPRGAVFNAPSNVHLKINPAARFEVLQELRSRAYGKVVKLEDDKGDVRTYRIAQANGSIINDQVGNELMVVNRLAPVARELTPALVGDKVVLPRVGLCTVIEVDLLDRYDRGNLYDFSRLIYSTGEYPDGEWRLEHLRSSVDEWRARDATREELSEGPTLLYEDGIFSEDSKASLGSSFYTRTTKKQEELIRRPPRGLLIVEGIAGSGKTSVALGRVKALHSAYQFSDEDELHDSFFKDQSEMVGFVLHKQLINYLEKTLAELNLSQMKVKEFKELQNDLLRKRGGVLSLKMPGNPKGKYSRVRDHEYDFEQSMEWLSLIEREMMLLFLDRASEKLVAHRKWISELDVKDIRIGRVAIDYRGLLNKSWSIAADSFLAWKGQLESRGTRGYLASGLVLRVKSVYEAFFDLVSEDARWYYYDSDWHRRPKNDEEISYPLQPFNGRHFTGRDSDWLRNLRDRARTKFRQALYMDTTVEHMPPLSDWYGEVVRSICANSQYKAAEVERIASRVAEAKLADSDLNVLLAITNIMSQGYEYLNTDQKRIADYLSAPRFHSTVFIDEVQDFTEIEVYLMGEQANPKRKAVTVVGDFKQQLYEGKVSDLGSCFPSASAHELQVAELLENKRQATNLANYSAHIRAEISNSEPPANLPDPVYGGDLTDQTCSSHDLPGIILERIIKTAGDHSIAVICPTNNLAKVLEGELHEEIQGHFRESQYSEDNRDLNKPLYVHFTVPKPTKGLEFDVVIAPYFNRFDLKNSLEANAAYVTVSRSRKRLHLINVE